MKSIQNIFLTMAKTFLGTALFVYLIYHLMTGQNGLLSYHKLQKKLEETQVEHAKEQQTRDILENKVKRLYPNSLDADLLDEQLRRVTGKVDSDEIIFFDR